MQIKLLLFFAASAKQPQITVPCRSLSHSKTSQGSLGLVLWGPWTSVTNALSIDRAATEIFQKALIALGKAFALVALRQDIWLSITSSASDGFPRQRHWASRGQRLTSKLFRREIKRKMKITAGVAVTYRTYHCRKPGTWPRTRCSSRTLTPGPAGPWSWSVH